MFGHVFHQRQQVLPARSHRARLWRDGRTGSKAHGNRVSVCVLTCVCEEEYRTEKEVNHFKVIRAVKNTSGSAHKSTLSRIIQQTNKLHDLKLLQSHQLMFLFSSHFQNKQNHAQVKMLAQFDPCLSLPSDKFLALQGRIGNMMRQHSMRARSTLTTVGKKFYMYDGPQFKWRDLLTCYRHENGRTAPWEVFVGDRVVDK